MRLGQAMRTALGGLAVRIAHIGSTAVPGLATKDVIDTKVATMNGHEAAAFQWFGRK